MKCCGPKTRYSILLVVGLIFIALPLALHDFINDTIRKTIAKNFVLTTHSKIYDEWKKPTLPIYLQLHTLNIMNPLEVKKGKPPAVVEKGPYSYRESREKVNVSWGDSNVTYNQVTTYVFDNETSCGTCNPEIDKFTTFNIPLMTIIQLLKPFVGRWWKEIAQLVLEYIDDDVFIEKTVNQTIWGYEDPLFEDYNKLRKLLVELPLIGHLFNGLPSLPSMFVLQANPSYDGVTTIRTGQTNIDNLGLYKEWKGHKHLHIWKSKIANMLNGTDGSLYKPHITKDDNLYIFVTQICRSLFVNYLSDSSSIRGISALLFHPPKSIFTSGSEDPDNKGFCNPNCLPSGLLSVNACVPFNAPIVVSSPHFLNGDPILLKKVLGLHPDPKKHDTFLYVEPNTGALLQASKRLQFNIHVEPVKGFFQTSGLASTFVPIMWINEHVRIDSNNADKLKKEVLDKLEIVKWVERGFYILGGLMVLIALILFLRLCRRRKDESHLNLVAENGHTNHYGATSNQGHLNPSLINASD